MSDPTLERESFSNETARYLTVGYMLGFALLGFITSTSSESSTHYFGYGMVFAGVLGAIRGARSATAIVSEDEVLLRSYLHTRRVQMAAIDAASLAVGAIGFGSPRRVYLRLHLRDGSTVNFRELNAPSAASRSDARAAAAYITRMAARSSGTTAVHEGRQ